MSPAALLARVEAAGFRVEVGSAGPKLVRTADGATCPPELLADLAAHRDAVARAVVAAAVLARAGGANRPVWGYDSDDGRATVMTGNAVPDRWDRLCVEGDGGWTPIPRAGGDHEG